MKINPLGIPFRRGRNQKNVETSETALKVTPDGRWNRNPDNGKSHLKKSFGFYASSARNYLRESTRNLKDRIVSKTRLSLTRDSVVNEYTTPRRNIKRKREPEKKRSKRIRRSLDLEADLNEPKESIKRHTMGRWSFPAAASLTIEVNPDDIEPQRVTPLRPVEIKQTTMELPMTPKRRRSSCVSRKITFGNRECLRRLSMLRKTLHQSKIPIMTGKTSPKINVKKPIEKALNKTRTLPDVKRSAIQSIETKKPVRNSLVVPKQCNKSQSLRSECPDGKTLTELFKEFQRGYLRFRGTPTGSLPTWQKHF